MKTQENSLITDEQTLVGAKDRFGRSLRVYDDGYGPIYISRDSLGINGIVRAQTWEDAYSICEDEFFPEAEETLDEIIKEYNHKRESVKIIHPIKNGEIDFTQEKEAELSDYPLKDKQFIRWETKITAAKEDEQLWIENGLFQESFGLRPNGPNTRDKLNHGIYAKDLNGDYLDQLTPELLKELEITLEIKNDENALIPLENTRNYE